jgi:hypothetical protein
MAGTVMAKKASVFSDDRDELRLMRHAALSTALPFPDLDWTDRSAEKENLALLRDYCESLANGITDWYLRNHRRKKWMAQWLHRGLYLFVALAGFAPLLKIGFVDIFSGLLSNYWRDALNSHAAEIAVFFGGLAGAVKLFDSNGGYTVDWMRFITTAARITQELTRFQFNWDKIDLTRRRHAASGAAAGKTAKRKPDDAHGDVKPASAGGPALSEICPCCGYSRPITELDPTERQVELAREFCAKILDMVDGEISVWADELKKRVERLDGQRPAQGK